MSSQSPYFIDIDGQQFFVSKDKPEVGNFILNLKTNYYGIAGDIYGEYVVIQCECGQCPLEYRTRKLKDYVKIVPVKPTNN
jgi:hypothetical protein